MEYLPSELKLNILSRVPAGSLFPLRCVCKYWQALVDDPFFREIHTDRLLIDLSDNKSSTDPVNVSLFQKISVESADTKLFSNYMFGFAEFRSEEDDDEFSNCYKVSKPITTPPGYDMKSMNLNWSSCNGLICLFNNYNPVVFNPLTRECMYIPHPKNRYLIDVWGFGCCHPCSKEYKVVAIFKFEQVLGERIPQQIHVHTVGSRKWRYAGEVPACFNYCEREEIPGVLVNGALHWLDLNGMIVAFDLSSERFVSVQPPPFFGLSVFDFYGAKLSLGVSRNSLSVTSYKESQYIEMWVNDYKSTWTKVLNIPIIEGSPLCNRTIKYKRCMFTTVTKCGKILFYFMGMMASYDPKKEKVSIHKYKGLTDAVLHSNSFVSLKDFKRFEQIQAS